MTIHKIRKPTSSFEVVPRATLQDQRLGCSELGALLRLCSLPDGWVFRSEHIEKMLGVGRDKRKALQKKLRTLGYHNLRASRNQFGEWIYEYVFSVAGDLPLQGAVSAEPKNDANSPSDGNSGDGESMDDDDGNSGEQGEGNMTDSTCDGFPGDGDAGDGKDGAIENTDGLKNTAFKENTPLPPAPEVGGVVGGGEDLVFPEGMAEGFVGEIRDLIEGKTDAQAILDELAAALAHPEEKHRIRHPVSWVESVILGRLRRTPAGLALGLVRARQAMVQRSLGAFLPPVDPLAQAAGEELLANVRKKREAST